VCCCTDSKKEPTPSPSGDAEDLAYKVLTYEKAKSMSVEQMEEWYTKFGVKKGN